MAAGEGAGAGGVGAVAVDDDCEPPQAARPKRLKAIIGVFIMRRRIRSTRTRSQSSKDNSAGVCRGNFDAERRCSGILVLPPGPRNLLCSRPLDAPPPNARKAPFAA